MKICPRCKVEKAETGFSKSKATYDGLQGYCRLCRSEYYKKDYAKDLEASRLKARERYAKNPPTHAQSRTRHIKSAYNISLEDCDSLIKKQLGRCKICLERFPSIRTPHIDHNHKTKKIRGILCQCCNWGLGNFKDSPERLRAAAVYLENSCLDKTLTSTTSKDTCPKTQVITVIAS